MTIPPESLDFLSIKIHNVQLELSVQNFYPYDASFHNEITISSPCLSSTGCVQSNVPTKLRQRISPTSFFYDKLYFNITSLIQQWCEQPLSAHQIMLSLKKPNLCFEIFNQIPFSPRLYIEYEAVNEIPTSTPTPPTPTPCTSTPSVLYLNSYATEVCIDCSCPMQFDVVHSVDSNSDSIPDINYSTETSYFCFNTPGYYYLNWIINLIGTGALDFICIGLVNRSTKDILEFHSPCMMPEQICGQYVLHITEAPTEYALINNSVGAIQLCDINTRSSLVIMKL